MRRRVLWAVAGVLALGGALGAVPAATAQVLPPLPPLPAPPAEGSVLSDALGPIATSYCDTVATVYALAGPIAQAQLPPELRSLVDEITPYLSVVTYACGFLATPPTTAVCATDSALAEQMGALGLPVAAPTPIVQLYETAAGIEHVFLRAGIDIGTEVSRQLATVLGCGEGAAQEEPPAATPPAVPAAPTGAVAPGLALGGTARVVVPPVVATPGTPGSVTRVPGVTGRAGSVRYPVDGLATALLSLPLAALIAGAWVGPRLRRRSHGVGSSGAGS
jgi:hypothetical protein